MIKRERGCAAAGRYREVVVRNRFRTLHYDPILKRTAGSSQGGIGHDMLQGRARYEAVVIRCKGQRAVGINAHEVVIHKVTGVHIESIDDNSDWSAAADDGEIPG